MRNDEDIRKTVEQMEDLVLQLKAALNQREVDQKRVAAMWPPNTFTVPDWP